MSTDNGRERRGPPRFEVRLSAEVTFEGRVFTTKTLNLSVGGICLECDRELTEGAPIKVSLFLVVDDVEDATLPPLHVRGTVAWSTPGEPGKLAMVGVRFQGLSEMQLGVLTRFLKLVS